MGGLAEMGRHVATRRATFAANPLPLTLACQERTCPPGPKSSSMQVLESVLLRDRGVQGRCQSKIDPVFARVFQSCLFRNEPIYSRRNSRSSSVRKACVSTIQSIMSEGSSPGFSGRDSSLTSGNPQPRSPRQTEMYCASSSNPRTFCNPRPSRRPT